MLRLRTFSRGRTAWRRWCTLRGGGGRGRIKIGYKLSELLWHAKPYKRRFLTLNIVLLFNFT